MSINKNVFEWFLLIICKGHTPGRAANLFNKNHTTLYFLLSIRRSADVQYWTINLLNWQKQPPEALYKKSCSQKFRNFHRKTPAVKSLFHKVADLQACNFLKKRLQHSCFPVTKFLQNTYFEEHLRTAATELFLRSDCLELCFWTVAFKTILTQ